MIGSVLLGLLFRAGAHEPGGSTVPMNACDDAAVAFPAVAGTLVAALVAMLLCWSAWWYRKLMPKPQGETSIVSPLMANARQIQDADPDPGCKSRIQMQESDPGFRSRAHTL